MKIDFSQKLTNVDGSFIQELGYDKEGRVALIVEEQENEKGETVQMPVHMTLKNLCVRALYHPEEKIDGVEICKRNALAEKIYKTESVLSVTVGDIGLLKKLIHLMEKRTRVIAEAWKMLEGDDDEE